MSTPLAFGSSPSPDQVSPLMPPRHPRASGPQRFATGCALLLLLACGCLDRIRAAESAWIEAEIPSSSNFEHGTGGWGNSEYLSGEDWLHFTIPAGEVEEKVPAKGIVVGYVFEVEATGEYEVWGRVGYEFVRSPFEWRIDSGEWDEIDPEVDLSTDLMEIQRWNEIAWVPFGRTRLRPGNHILEIRHTVRYRGEGESRKPDRLIYSADVYCVHRGTFRPNGKHRPGDAWRTDRDRAATARSFVLPDGGAAGERAVLPLEGDWEIARHDEREGVVGRTEPMEAPDVDSLHWSAIRVPGDRNQERPDLSFCHRYLYRTRVTVPESWRGSSFFLDFTETSMLTTVFVNGERVAFHDAPLTGFIADVSSAILPGGTNEILVGIKDAYYAIEPTEERSDTRLWFNIPLDDMDRNQGVTMRFDYPVKGHTRNGITDHVSFVATGAAYSEDVFAIPSVSRRRLGLEVTVRNPGSQDLELAVDNAIVPVGETVEAKRFATTSLRVEAGGRGTARLEESWPTPHLWWPDDPYLYRVVTRVRQGTRVLDVKETEFGFREWTIEGTRFVLNGVPWQLRANLDYYSASAGGGEKAVAWWRESGQNMFRLRFQERWGGMTQNEALAFFDAQGVPVRRTVSTLDGQHASYGLVEFVQRDGRRTKVPRTSLFENWRKQIAQRVRQQRNHPSIFVWELDNEIIYINTRNFGNLDVVEPEFTKAARLIEKLDGQGRGVMVAGGRALMDQTLPVNGCHYEESELRDYPDMAYGLGEWTAQTSHQPWPMAKDRPIFLSETYFSHGWNPAKFAAVGGGICFLGRAETRDACGRIARMYSEGYRWQELGAFHYWFGRYGDEHYRSWQPVVALCREWNTTFAGGSRVRRTIMVRNDTRFADPIDLEWELRVGSRKVAGRRVTCRAAPGHGEIVTVDLPVPEVSRRTAGAFILSCYRLGGRVWTDRRGLSIIDPDAAPRPDVAPGGIVVMDPDGAARRRLAARGIPHRSVDDLSSLPDRYRLLIVGRDALSPRLATDPIWKRLAAEGRRVLVLEQEHPLHFQAVPADFIVTDWEGRVAFPENLEHPVFGGLAASDFFTWSGDHVVYRRAYRKATRGARSLVQCDDRLSASALAECPVGEGLLLLSQLVVGRKLESDPVARRLFDNLVNYALEYRLKRSATTVAIAPDDLRSSLLRSSGLEYRQGESGVTAARDPKCDIAIVDATPERLRELVEHRSELREFTERGGWLILWGVTPEGLGSFNQLVGQQHVMRPFRREKVSLAAIRDPLSSGLSQRDVSLLSGERIFGWTRDEYVDDAVFTHVVDLEDIAPFCEGPGIEGTSSIVNGMTSTDAWKYIYYMPMLEDGSPQTLTLQFPAPQTVTGLSIVPNAHYWLMQDVRLVFDGDESKARDIRLADYDKSSNDRQDFELEPVEASSVTLVPRTWKEASERAILGIDNLWLRVRRPDDFRERVRPLLNIGALVKYPRGDGGILLCELRVRDREPVPVNAEKKQAIVTTILRNLGAVFAVREELAPGAGLAYRPLSLEGVCNLYLSAERGWPDREHDLSHLPLDRQRMGGVDWIIRDFKTSPLESAVALAGFPGLRDGQRSVRIPVGGKCDALFFLHTFFERHPWRPRRESDASPVIWKYVVRWADGQSHEVPVLYGLGARDYRQESPQGLRDAGLAWAAAFPGDDARSAVLFQLQWDNPRPDVAIEAVEMAYDDRIGNRHGSPVLLAVTAATVAER